MNPVSFEKLSVRTQTKGKMDQQHTGIDKFRQKISPIFTEDEALKRTYVFHNEEYSSLESVIIFTGAEEEV